MPLPQGDERDARRFTLQQNFQSEFDAATADVEDLLFFDRFSTQNLGNEPYCGGFHEILKTLRGGKAVEFNHYAVVSVMANWENIGVCFLGPISSLCCCMEWLGEDSQSRLRKFLCLLHRFDLGKSLRRSQVRQHKT